jgi:hypothetical protein
VASEKSMFTTSKVGFEVADIWKKVFVGDPQSDIQVVVIDHYMDYKYVGVLGMFGPDARTQMTYHATVKVTIRGKEFTLETEGRRQAAVAINSAIRQSVELAIVDLSKRIKELDKQIR